MNAPEETTLVTESSTPSINSDIIFEGLTFTYQDLRQHLVCQQGIKKTRATTCTDALFKQLLSLADHEKLIVLCDYCHQLSKLCRCPQHGWMLADDSWYHASAGMRTGWKITVDSFLKFGDFSDLPSSSRERIEKFKASFS